MRQIEGGNRAKIPEQERHQQRPDLLFHRLHAALISMFGKHDEARHDGQNGYREAQERGIGDKGRVQRR
ncbi:hypothetical protein N8D56_18360 [Devosia sp. A8/3-2]|nr:hypothetical protein N8D56_18360 [Devosia sp. A8/3-2]